MNRRGHFYPASFRGYQYLTIVAFAAIVGLVVATSVTKPLTFHLVNLWLIYSLAAVGFYLIFGLSGQFAFSQAFMMAVGGYVSAWVTKALPSWVGLLVGVAVAAVISVGFAAMTTRTSHFFFAIATFGLSQIGILVIQQWPALGGNAGQILGIPPSNWFGIELIRQREVFWLFLAVLTVGLLLAALLERSPIRRELLAIKDNETVASTLGIPVFKHRLVTFVIGSCYGAAAGSLYAHWQTSLSTDAFNLDLGTGIFLMVVLGGLGSKWGAVLGAGFYVFMPKWLEVAVQYQALAYGILLVVIMVVCPQGLIGLAESGLAWIWRRWARRGPVGRPPSGQAPAQPVAARAEG